MLMNLHEKKILMSLIYNSYDGMFQALDRMGHVDQVINDPEYSLR